MPHRFTRDEAEALLPRLSPILTMLQAEWDELIAASAAVAQMRQRILGNGHGLLAEMRALAQRYETTRARTNLLIAQVREFGCELKDPRTGLVDFPAQRFGHPILLCWRLGEPRIAWWHAEDAGFDGRQPLE